MSAMSFPDFTTNSGCGTEVDNDESDFGEFSSASPKSDSLAPTNHPTKPTNPSTSNRFDQEIHPARHTVVNSHGKINTREPNGYIPGHKISSSDDCGGRNPTQFLVTESQFEISDTYTDNAQTISVRFGRQSELCVTPSDSTTSDPIPTFDTDPHSSTVVQNCQSSSTAADKSSRHVDGPSVLSGSKLIGSAQSNLGRAKPDSDLAGSVGSDDSHNFSEWVSSPESSLPTDVNPENSCTHAECVCETCEFDDFQSVLDEDDFQERIMPTGQSSHSWGSFGNVGVRGDDGNSWLAFQDVDVETGKLDDQNAAQMIDSHVEIIPPNCADDVGRKSDNFRQSEIIKKKNVREFLELVFPPSSCVPPGNETSSSIGGTSHGSGAFRPDLFDLIGERSEKIDPSTDRSRSSGSVGRSSSSVWNSLKVMEDTAALKFHWTSSRSNRLLLKSVAMESPTRLKANRIQKLPAASPVQEMPEHRAPASATASCRHPYETSFSQTVLSVAHLRM